MFQIVIIIIISAEAQTYRKEDLVGPGNRNTYRVVQQQQCDQPSIIKQYGGQIFRQSMDICGYNHSRPLLNTKNVGLWKEIIDQRNFVEIPISSYDGELKVQQTHNKEQDQRYDTEVKRIEDN